MPRRFASLIAFTLSLLCAPPGFAQAPATAICNFDPATQLAVEYQPLTISPGRAVFGREIPYNKVWAPGGKPMTMFVNHPIAVGGREVGVGAYTLYVIPAEKQWTLIISRSTDTSGKYDEHADLARVPMQWGELSSPEDRFSIYFAHLSPRQCTMRLDLDRARAWVDFEEK